MSKDESKPEPSDIRESIAEDRPFPKAWQPLTACGVAAFSRATIGRLLIVQLIVAVLLTVSILWFLSANWFPTVREAIRQLPETGQIRNQVLNSPRTSTAPLAETRFLAFMMDVEGAGTPSIKTDLRVQFHRNKFAFCSVLGCLALDYPKDRTVLFSRLELESWWAAWEPVIYTIVGLFVLVWLFLSWIVIATIYSPVARIYAFFKDRRLTLLGSWKLSAAALLPAAMLTGAGIVLYGLGIVDLIGFLVLFALHLPVGWAYLFVSPLRLPRASDAVPAVRQNPFTPPGAVPSNPFGDPSASPPEEPPPKQES